MTDMRITTLIVALCALFGFGVAAEKADAQIVFSVGIAPPVLPVYVQPPIPGPGYLWTPGYWAWNEEIGEYYWVPGAWVLPPRVGLLWTPGYWGWSGGAYVWNAGYWGPTVGFYGGVCYGFGYTGVGFAGGYWSGDSFYYNRSVTNISNTTVINNVYNQQVVNNHTTNVSYNGGNGGLRAQPTQRELQAANEQHIAPTHEQQNHQQLASQNKDLRASVNHGAPAIAAVGKAGDFSSHNVVAAHAAGSPVKPASLTSSNGLNAHAAGNLAANGGAGPIQHGAIHGANKNAVANLNTGPSDRPKTPGSAPMYRNGAPPHPNGGPMTMNGRPFNPNRGPMRMQGASMQANGGPIHPNRMPFHANAAPFHPNGAPFHANAAPFRANGAPMQMSGVPPRGAGMIGGGPVPHGQPHPNMPRPAAYAQPHPAGQPRKDQPHG
jgi:WXXGXW repeat (2 copies)